MTDTRTQVAFAAADDLDRRAAIAAWAKDGVIVFILLGLVVALTIGSDAFLTSRNLLNVLASATGLGIVACGVTIVLIAGGFDLSVGAVFALCGIITATLTGDLGAGAAIAIGLLSGLSIGIINGVLVAFGRMNSFLTTLATGIIVIGLTTLITDGLIVSSEDDPAIAKLGHGSVLGFRYSTWLFLTFAAVLAAVLAWTAFGRYVHAIGTNAEVARLAGVRVRRVRAATFAISGFAAGLAGILAMARVGQSGNGVGDGLELAAIAVVAIGGTSVFGGEGAIWRTLVGLAILSLLNNGLNLLNVSDAIKLAVPGALILFAVSIDVRARQQSRRGGRLRMRLGRAGQAMGLQGEHK